MENIRQYILSVTTAAILCGLVNGMIGKNKSYGSIVKLLTGLILAITFIEPLTDISFYSLAEFQESIFDAADSVTADGVLSANQEKASIIKSRTEAYILDKASDMDLAVTVDVELSSQDRMLPAFVRIQGPASPYAKEVLSNFIANDLGISKENQLWI